jgi:hypothetical protein
LIKKVNNIKNSKLKEHFIEKCHVKPEKGRANSTCDTMRCPEYKKIRNGNCKTQIILDIDPSNQDIALLKKQEEHVKNSEVIKVD